MFDEFVGIVIEGGKFFAYFDNFLPIVFCAAASFGNAFVTFGDLCGRLGTLAFQFLER